MFSLDRFRSTSSSSSSSSSILPQHSFDTKSNDIDTDTDTDTDIDPSLESRSNRELAHQLASSQISANQSVSCLTSFDQLLSCYSLSNQLKSIYRYGQLNHHCTQKLNDFKFCLSLNLLDHHQRSIVWNCRKAERILGGPNSEDVWDARPVVPLELSLFK